MPQVADGDDNRPPTYEMRRRPNGVWAIYRNRRYLITTKTRDEHLAGEILELHVLQDGARARNLVDARFVQATVVIDHFLRTYPKTRRSYKGLRSRWKLLRPYLEGRRIQDLNGDWLIDTEEKMVEEDGYAYATFAACMGNLITAIRRYCQDKLCPVIVPFHRPDTADGRDRVLTPAERDRILRWADGTETYDPKTGTWTPALRPLGRIEANRRLMVGREVRLGLPLGSRPGVYRGMAWEPNAEFGHIDLANATLHRVPSGSSKKGRKSAPVVALPPALLAEVRAWREADGDQPYVFRTASGKPLPAGTLGSYFAAAMVRLGLPDVTGHSLRHTAITWMIERGLSASVISAICGISISMLKRRYDHSDNRVVQAIGHDVMDSLLA
jgi:integrase